MNTFTKPFNILKFINLYFKVKTLCLLKKSFPATIFKDINLYFLLEVIKFCFLFLGT